MTVEETAARELSFRRPMTVIQARMSSNDGAYPVCPQCKISLEREYQCFCDRCGQRLGWEDYGKARIIYPQKKEGHR